MVLSRHEQESSDEVGGRHSLRALHHLHAPGLLHLGVGVATVGRRRQIVAVHAVVAVELDQELEGRIVGSVENN